MDKHEYQVTLAHFVTDTKSEINAVCPKCRVKIPLSGEAVQNQQTYTCPQCGAIHDTEPLRRTIREVREGKVPIEQKVISKISVRCPKCFTSIPVQEEQLQYAETYFCPKCRHKIDVRQLREAIQDARVYQKPALNVAGAGSPTQKEVYQVIGVCPGCQTRIPVSIEQLQHASTYSCPQCGGINDMAPLREAVRGKQGFGQPGHDSLEPGRKSGYQVSYNLPGNEFERKTVTFSRGAIIRMVIGVLIIALITIFFLYRFLNPG